MPFFYFCGMSEHHELGELGESLAADYLLKNEYHLLERNWRYLKGEIDIIAEKDKQIIIVEVKTRSSDEVLRPQDAVTIKKQKEIIKTAHAYLEKKELDTNTRFDIISIIIRNGKTSIDHIEDAFYPTL